MTKLSRLVTTGATLLLSAVMLTVSACSSPFSRSDVQTESRIDAYLTSTAPVSLQGKDITVSFDETFRQKMDDASDAVYAAVTDASSNRLTFILRMNTFNSLFKQLSADYKYADILRGMTCTDEAYALVDEIYDYYLEKLSFLRKLERKIADGKFRSVYFADMTDQEIEDYLARYDADASEEATAIGTAINDLKSAYSQGKQTFADTYPTLIAKQNEYAALSDYDNYADYAYDVVYARDYTYKESSYPFSYAVETIAPLYQQLSATCKEREEALTDDQKQELTALKTDFMGPYLNTYQDYAAFVGGHYQTAYQTLWSSGNYFFSNNALDTTTTAYTSVFADSGEPYLFFSRNYQDISTFSHEFGHYYAFSYDTGEASLCYDLCEVQSQADELLFAEYLATHTTGISRAVCQVNLTETICSLLQNILKCGAVNQAEMYAYTHPDAAFDEIYAYFCKIWEQSGLPLADTPEKSYLRVAVTSSCYYVSYATSAFSTLGIHYLTETQGIDAAKTAYVKSVEYDEDLTTFRGVVVSAGLFDPFCEMDYDRLVSLFETA